MRRISDFIPSPSIGRGAFGQGGSIHIDYFNNPPNLYIKEADTSIGKCTPYGIGKAISPMVDLRTSNNFVCPLFINSSEEECESTISALETFIRVGYFNYLNKVTLEGKEYYGNRWIILDSNYKIVYMICFVNRTISHTSLIFMFSGNFLFNEKNKLSKAFSLKLIPEITSLGDRVLIESSVNTRNFIVSSRDIAECPSSPFNITNENYMNEILRSSIMEIIND